MYTWSINGALIGVHASHSMDGVAYAFTKGPAGQTPFPSLITMSSYFPQCHKSQPREVHGNPSSDLSSKSRPTHARKPSINVHPGYPTKGMDNPKSTIPRNKDSKTMSPANSQSSLNAFQLLQ
ncbi:hypothetical protein BGZ46_004052 [Entomortierella lignicola]|nr:hypothetical protein BGZ46_004052 [Entomortierella lignicola]